MIFGSLYSVHNYDWNSILKKLFLLDEIQNEIELKNLNKNDSGKYECKMFNSLGSGSDNVIIQVQCNIRKKFKLWKNKNIKF